MVKAFKKKKKKRVKKQNLRDDIMVATVYGPFTVFCQVTKISYRCYIMISVLFMLSTDTTTSLF